MRTRKLEWRMRETLPGCKEIAAPLYRVCFLPYSTLCTHTNCFYAYKVTMVGSHLTQNDYELGHSVHEFISVKRN
jgi:hypothetical protein